MNLNLNQRSHLDVTRAQSATLPASNDTDKRLLTRALTHPQGTIEYLVGFTFQYVESLLMSIK